MTSAIAMPSHRLTPTVWSAVASNRGSPAIKSVKRRTPCTRSSVPLSSTTCPSRTTLSPMMRLPRRLSFNAHARSAGLDGLCASMNARSKGFAPSASILGSVSSAAPTRRSTTASRPARFRFARATAAWRGSASSVTMRPPGGSPRAIQIVE